MAPEAIKKLGARFTAREFTAAIGLANTAVEAHAWRAHVDALGARLAAMFNGNLAAGKRTFYEQVAAPSLRARYEVATPVMVDMFESPEQKKKMADFLSKKSKKAK